jgi:hypothetical protein
MMMGSGRVGMRSDGAFSVKSPYDDWVLIS